MQMGYFIRTVKDSIFSNNCNVKKITTEKRDDLLTEVVVEGEASGIPFKMVFFSEATIFDSLSELIDNVVIVRDDEALFQIKATPNEKSKEVMQ